MYKMKNVTIAEIFTPKGGKSIYTKKYCKSNVGEYPVYSSNNNEIFMRINSYDYDGEYLTWSLVGCAGYITKFNGKFSITNNRGILILKDGINRDNLSLDYLSILIEPIFRKYKKGRLSEGDKNEYTSLNPKMINSIKDTIPIPIYEDGTYNLEAQIKIANKYKLIEKKKELLLQKKSEISNISICFLKDLKTTNVKISTLFIPKLGNGKYTKEKCLQIKGEYPVYSGNTFGCFACINEYQYEGEYLTWSKDGLAGYLMYHNEKFSITNHRGILIPTDKCINIDLNYIKIILEPILRKYIKGRLGAEGKNEYTTLSKDMIKKIEVPIKIPIKEDGSYDLDAQRKIVKKYMKVEEIKSKICKKIDELINMDILF